jgi:hypothetical protein
MELYMNTSTQSQEKADLMKVQVSASIDVYKHHMELFLKWMGLYGAVVAAIGVYVFNAGLKPYGKHLILILIALGSASVALGCFGMWAWVNELERQTNQISEELGVTPSPIFGGKRQLIYMLIVAVGTIFLSLWVWVRWDDIFI